MLISNFDNYGICKHCNDVAPLRGHVCIGTRGAKESEVYTCDDCGEKEFIDDLHTCTPQSKEQIARTV